MPRSRAASKARRKVFYAPRKKQPREGSPSQAHANTKGTEASNTRRGGRLPARSQWADSANARKRAFGSRSLKRRCIFSAARLREHAHRRHRAIHWKSSQPTFFRYFLARMQFYAKWGGRAFARQAESPKVRARHQSDDGAALATILRNARECDEVGRPLWQAVILAGAMDPVRSPELRGAEAATVSLLREIIAEGQKKARREITAEISRSYICTNSWKDFQYRRAAVGC